MKKVVRYPLYVTLSALMCFAFAACDDGDDPIIEGQSEKDELLEAACKQFVNETVVPTYTLLADDTEELVDKLRTLKDDKTDANVRAACTVFLQARAWWELSEAFLFGPAGDFGIDPHIDSWPLDVIGLMDELANDAHIRAMEAEDADEWAGNTLGPSLLGFHGIEYILFKEGAAKPAAEILDKELTYALAVAGDLRNKCYQLQVSWEGQTSGNKDRFDKVVNGLEAKYSINDTGRSYGENMLNAGRAGSTYASWADAAEAIIDGCKTIADEVGTSKIGKPYTGEDKNYIESPYSRTSITDFYDNIRSVENAYMGGADETNRGASVHDYISLVNPTLDGQVREAIANALTKIKAMKAPFVLNFTDPSCLEASEACKALDDILTSVKSELRK